MKKKNYLSMIVLWVIEIENGTIGQIWKKTEILLLVRPLPSLMFPSLSTLPQFILYCIHLVVVGVVLPFYFKFAAESLEWRGILGFWMGSYTGFWNPRIRCNSSCTILHPSWLSGLASYLRISDGKPLCVQSVFRESGQCRKQKHVLWLKAHSGLIPSPRQC